MPQTTPTLFAHLFAYYLLICCYALSLSLPLFSLVLLMLVLATHDKCLFDP